MDEKRRPLQLSPREHQLIKFAADGLTDAAIAHRLGISEATVGTYWGRVRIKIGPYNRTELVSIYLRAQQEEALNELREQNALLLKGIQEAARTASDAESLYQGLIDNAPDAIVIVSESGTIVRANRAAEELFRYDVGEMSGLALVSLIPERFREVHQEHRKEYVSDPRRRKMGEHLETPALCKDGTETRVQAALSAMPSPNGLLVTCVLRLASET